MAEQGPEKDQWRFGPAWLRPLLRETFWQPCPVHREHNRNERNHFCLDCIGHSFCFTCLPDHQNHQTLQIRRSSYHNVLRVKDVDSLLDISLVQTYVLNADRVVFLNPRPLAPCHAVKCINDAGACRVCNRALVDAAFCFCSIACKLEKVAVDDSLAMTLDPELDEEPDESDGDDPASPPRVVISFRHKSRKGVPIRAPFF